MHKTTKNYFKMYFVRIIYVQKHYTKQNSQLQPSIDLNLVHSGIQ